jgi:ubiquinone/menaquinone biosynthesis C-methylase UbiE
MLREIQRVLIPGGLYLAISYGDPPNRIPLFEKAHLSFDVKCLVIQYPKTDSRDSGSREANSSSGSEGEISNEMEVSAFSDSRRVTTAISVSKKRMLIELIRRTGRK